MNRQSGLALSMLVTGYVFLQIIIGPELSIIAVIVLIPTSLIYIAYKLFQGFQEFQEGFRETRT
ncbi:MAG: hypothetical protein J07HQW2_00601 [Haloquadratum walsbyi J07HQW2]|uniref:Uncharacterized protein n=1 Tax=Haloquadratum walsbyi J07HQW2 TaxID=1238425 RepID=U1PKF4_9EURY|nr:MAG: hypothetical protein J07HQW2_00601 [Haloquadratum walsbyi J07HQW2]